MSVPVSGLAASIRNAVDSETFDLAGKGVSTIENAIRDAFTQPFALTDTIRITFVTGAGKLARQKYDEGAAKAVTSVLRELGYADDHSGGAGTFKLQHDTGKNLKTVVVHPKVTGVSATGIAGLSIGESSADATAAKSEPLLPEGSPEHKIAYSSMNVFKQIVESKCPGWGLKKGCAAVIEQIRGMVEAMDAKLLQGTPLTDPEQDFYDAVSMSSLDDKRTYLRDLMQKHVDESDLTREERRSLLEQISERLEALSQDIATAEKEQKPKRVENLKAQKEKAAERKKKVENMMPADPKPLKNEPQIAKLRLELKPLLDMEEAAKGRLLTLKESQAVARKEEILKEIEELENASRGWFESDEAFQSRVQASQNAFRAALKKQKAKKPATTTTTSSSASRSTAAKPGSAAAPAWVMPAPIRVKTANKTAAKSTSKTGGGVFAAMMADSDSD